MKKLLLNIVLPLLSLALILPASREAAAGTGPKARSSARPASVPADYVPTPFGLYVSPKCIITLNKTDEFAPGSFAVNDKYGIVLSADTFKPIPPCNLPRYNRDGSPYQQGADLMDGSTGNHDLIVSAKSDVPAYMTSTLEQMEDFFEAPGNVSGQIIFLTAAIAGRAKGWFQFYGFNMPGHENRWQMGTAISDVHGNVVQQFSNVKYSDYKPKLKFSIDNDRYNKLTPPSSEYRGSISYNDQSSVGLNYGTDDMLSNNIMLSLQTFGVTSCDMLPFSGKISGVASFQKAGPPFGKQLDVTPTTWSSGLCKLKATTQPDALSQNFTVTYDTMPPIDPQARSATITYTTK